MAGRPPGASAEISDSPLKERSAYSAPFFYAELISVDAPGSLVPETLPAICPASVSPVPDAGVKKSVPGAVFDCAGHFW